MKTELYKHLRTRFYWEYEDVWILYDNNLIMEDCFGDSNLEVIEEMISRMDLLDTYSEYKTNKLKKKYAKYFN